MVDFKIPDEEVRAMMATRLLDALSEDTREKLIQNALKFLVTPPRNHYSDGKSPVQAAFDQALQALAYKVADEILEEAGVATKLRDQFTELLVNIPEFDSDYTLQQKMMQAVLDRAQEVRRANAY